MSGQEKEDSIGDSRYVPPPPPANTAARAAMSRVRSDIVFSAASSAGDDPEGLHSPDWEDTDWKPPSLVKAEAHAASAKFLQGRAPFWSTGQDDLTLAGPGVSLYFRFLQRGICFFSLASVVSLPTLWLMWGANEELSAAGQGQRLLQDPLKLSQLSLGSFDGNTSAPLPGGGELDAADAGMVVVGLDLLIGLLFLVWYLVYGRDIERSSGGSESADRTVSIDDFSVHIRSGLPSDAHSREIHDFFDRLYALDKPDWSFPGYCGCLRCCAKRARFPSDADDRGIVMEEDEADTSPSSASSPAPMLVVAPPVYALVEDANHNPTSFNAVGTWIAETTLCRRDGDMILHFQGMKKRVKRSVHARAKIKYLRAQLEEYAAAGNTVTEKGAAAARQKRRRSIETRLAKVRKEYEKNDEKLKAKVEAFDTKQNIIEARDCVGAFIVFNNEESRARCLADYAGSTSWFWRALQPAAIRFRGKHPLVVVPAPTPGDVNWENQELTCKSACCRRSLTSVLALILILGAAVLAQQYKKIKQSIFPDDLPSFEDCKAWGSSDSPQWYMNCTSAATWAKTANASANFGSVTQAACVQCQ